MIQKNWFFYKHSPPFFFRISRLFPWYPDFIVKRQAKMLKLRNSWANITFLEKKITFPQKIPPDARIAVETNWEKNYRPSVFFIKLQRSVEEYINFKYNFPQNLPRISRSCSESGKKANVSLLKKKFSYIVPADIYSCFANPDKTFPPMSRKLQKFSENPEVFKTSFLKCCSLRVPLDT